jgi:hypothetical protein
VAELQAEVGAPVARGARLEIRHDLSAVAGGAVAAGLSLLVLVAGALLARRGRGSREALVAFATARGPP